MRKTIIAIVMLLAFSPVLVNAQNAPKKASSKETKSGDNKSKSKTTANTGNQSKSKSMERIKDQPDGMYALITTERGTILCSLYMDQTPLTVANFVGLAEGKLDNKAKPAGTPYYDGLVFHRVIPNFMIQGGDPQGTGQGGPGYSFADEFVSTLNFDKPGKLAMANAGPATNGSQFFITHVATTWLNQKHTIFGNVISADDQKVVDSVKQGDHMLKVEILRKGAKAQAFDAAGVFNKSLDEAKKKSEGMNAAQNAKLAEYKNNPAVKTTPSGLMYIINQPGSGANAGAGDTVSVHYTGTLLNGTKFDSSVDRGEPIKFPLGNHMVIQGWEEGLMLFNKGAKGKLIIPSNLAYGPQSPSPVIPPNSVLVFDIEMVNIAHK